ncbi:MAG: universal stress protein, partial [Pseudolabrys sp.]
NLFTMIVTMAVITTMVMPPTLRWALSRLPMRKDEKQRLEREEMEAKGFVPKLERLLLTVDESNNARLATRIAGLIAGGSAMPTTVMHIKNDKKTSKAVTESAKQKAEEVGMTVKEFAAQVDCVKKPEEKTDTKLDVTTIVEKAPKPEAVAEEAEKGYSLMIIGLQETVARRNEFHEDITKLATGFEGPLAVVDARDKLLEEPLDARFNILLPVNGNEYSRRAAEVAIAIARASRAPLTALYVAPGGRKRSRRYEEDILKDISNLAETYDTEIRTAVRANIASEEAILKELSRKPYNLVVIGAGRRPGEKLFFGDTAAALLEKSERSLLFVAS